MRKIWLIAMTAMLMTTGCGGSVSKTEGEQKAYRDQVSAQALAEAAASELGEEYWADEDLAPEYLDDWYGISDSMYEEYYGQVTMTSDNVDTLIIVKASDEYLDDVQNAFDTYREAMVQDSLQSQANILKLQEAQIRTFGNYVCYVQLGGSMDGGTGDETAMAEACREANELALSVIEKKLSE